MPDSPTDDENEEDGSIEFLPPLELLTPAPENCIVIRCPDHPLHISPDEAIGTGRIKGVESVEILVMDEGETEAEQWLIVYLFTVDDALDEWDTHLANIRGNNSVPRQVPPFTLEQISSVRKGIIPYIFEEVQREEPSDAPPPQGLSSAAELIWTRIREMDKTFDEELDQYDQVFVLLLPDLLITTDSARLAIRDVIEEHLPDLAMHGPVLDDYTVPPGFADIQLRYTAVEGKTYMAETREEYLKYAAMRDVIWIEEMAPAMAALNATRLLSDKEEREWREGDEEKYQDDILLGLVPLPSVMFEQALNEPSPESDPVFAAASAELRIPLEDPEGLLFELESQSAHAQDLPELMFEQTLETLRVHIQEARK